MVVVVVGSAKDLKKEAVLILHPQVLTQAYYRKYYIV